MREKFGKMVSSSRRRSRGRNKSEVRGFLIDRWNCKLVSSVARWW